MMKEFPARSLTRLTALGHSCVLIESAVPDAPVLRVLLDPGNLTPALDDIGLVDAVLVTHPHIDHLDPAQISRIQWNGRPRIYGGAGVAEVLQEAGQSGVLTVEAGQFEVDGLPVEALKAAHEPIYPGLPVPTNLAYLIAGQVFAPGDSFAPAPGPVDTLLLAIGAPWMKLSEAIDYFRLVAPRRAVPVHDGGLAAAHRALHLGLMEKFAPEGSTLHPLSPSETLDL